MKSKDNSPGVELAKGIINSQKKWGDGKITKEKLRDMVNDDLKKIKSTPYDNFGFESVWNQVKDLVEE